MCVLESGVWGVDTDRDKHSEALHLSLLRQRPLAGLAGGSFQQTEAPYT